jgi:hypothetical protein
MLLLLWPLLRACAHHALRRGVCRTQHQNFAGLASLAMRAETLRNRATIARLKAQVMSDSHRSLPYPIPAAASSISVMDTSSRYDNIEDLCRH